MSACSSTVRIFGIILWEEAVEHQHLHCSVSVPSQVLHLSTPSSTRVLTSVTPTLEGCSVLGFILQRTHQRVTSTSTGSEEGRAALCTKIAAVMSARGTRPTSPNNVLAFNVRVGGRSAQLNRFDQLFLFQENKYYWCSKTHQNEYSRWKNP